MASDLFYFMSSLPMLKLGEKPFMNHGAFMADCASCLGEEVAVRLGRLRLLPGELEPGASDVCIAWHDFETFLRNAVAQVRRNRRFRGQGVFTARGTDYCSQGEAKQVETIMEMQSPLERETALDEFRWRFLDDLSAGHSFDMASLEVYAIKLLLLEKRFSRNLEGGRAAFEELMGGGLAKAREVRVDNE